MGDPVPQRRPMSVADFLAWNDGTDTRYELVDGEIIVMNPPRAPHARLVVELGAALRSRLPPHCGVYAGGGATLQDDEFNYRIPDLTVSFVQSREHWVEQPRLVVEILSQSTQKYDITGQLVFYRSIPSIDEILLVRFDRRWCELWQRVGDNWSIENHIGSALLPLRATTSPLPLDEIYGPLDL
ncbi:MAG: Uma2 family endonuclease [Geminicoccaceae bacterium]